MLKDIEFPKVNNIAVAIVKDEENTKWHVYLINLKDKTIKNILISSKGYGQNHKGVKLKTSTLRYFIDKLPPKSFARIEPITEEVFSITNEYWISFYINNKVFDKKFIFVAESINEKNLTNIPLINKKGIMIK